MRTGTSEYGVIWSAPLCDTLEPRAAEAGVDHVWEGIREHNIERQIDSRNAGRILEGHLRLTTTTFEEDLELCLT